VSVLILAQSVV